MAVSWLVEPALELPHLCEVVGNIVGVGFDPGRNEVRLKYADRQLTLSATASQVDRALLLRHAEVRILAMISEPHSRLLRIQDAETEWSIPPREDAVFKRWDGLLGRLAQ